MRSGLLLLAALPSALAAAFAHSAVRAAHHRSLGGENCLLPSSYTIQHFKARKTKTGTTISQFDFTYLDNMTNVTTLCQYNSSSVTFTPAEGAPRYSCRNRNVEFIWQGDSRMIWMGEKICPSSNGQPQYVVSGTTSIPLTCLASTGVCRPNSTSYTTSFTSLDPVMD